jgi:metal-responsive CopG/Arc/MetJ family transcriptional regulator
VTKPAKPRHPGGRPPLPPGQRRVRIHMLLHPKLVARLDAASQATGETRTETIERAIMQLVSERERRAAEAVDLAEMADVCPRCRRSRSGITAGCAECS